MVDYFGKKHPCDHFLIFRLLGKWVSFVLLLILIVVALIELVLFLDGSLPIFSLFNTQEIHCEL